MNLMSRIWSVFPDKCEVCHGESGGIRGNENIVRGITMCDYCDAANKKLKDVKLVTPYYLLRELFLNTFLFLLKPFWWLLESLRLN